MQEAGQVGCGKASSGSVGRLRRSAPCACCASVLPSHAYRDWGKLLDSATQHGTGCTVQFASSATKPGRQELDARAQDAQRTWSPLLRISVGQCVGRGCVLRRWAHARGAPERRCREAQHCCAGNSHVGTIVKALEVYCTRSPFASALRKAFHIPNLSIECPQRSGCPRSLQKNSAATRQHARHKSTSRLEIAPVASRLEPRRK